MHGYFSPCTPVMIQSPGLAFIFPSSVWIISSSFVLYASTITGFFLNFFTLSFTISPHL
nr:MAG TPA: hypothetical protein [Caudoviricetes sp.]